MTERMHTTFDVMKAGDYDWQRLGAWVLGICSGIEALAALGDKLPPTIAPYVIAVRGWAAVFGVVVSGVLGKLGKPVLVE